MIQIRECSLPVNLAVFGVNMNSIALCAKLLRWYDSDVLLMFFMLKYLVGCHLADRVTSFQCLQLFQTPVQLIQSLYGQLLVRLLCTRQREKGIMGWIQLWKRFLMWNFKTADTHCILFRLIGSWSQINVRNLILFSSS